jgi:hypothetical protein
MNVLFRYLHHKSREKKYRLFQELLRPRPESRILNLGASGTRVGLPDQFERLYPHPDHIVGGGLAEADVRDYAESFPWVKPIIFDGCALPFPDRSFDIVYSNAVLEHLPGWEAQQRFAQEVMRVGRSWFITTPNYWYPIDAHYHLPLVQFLSTPGQQRLARALGKVPYPALHLLDSSKLEQLFPGGRIVRCRVTFYPETLIAVGGIRGEIRGC